MSEPRTLDTLTAKMKADMESMTSEDWAELSRLAGEKKTKKEQEDHTLKYNKVLDLIEKLQLDVGETATWLNDQSNLIFQFGKHVKRGVKGQSTWFDEVKKELPTYESALPYARNEMGRQWLKRKYGLETDDAPVVAKKTAKTEKVIKTAKAAKKSAAE
jgi:hypothetical protein